MKTTLRPHQVSQFEDTKNSLNAKLSNKNVQDKGAVRAQLSRLEREFEAQNPVEFTGEAKDKAVKECDDLLEKIVVGMPSQEEMRKSPPGAIGKHRDWEKRNKESILDWKELRLRLNVGSDDPDIANLEMHRPTRSSLSMDNAYIPGNNIFLPETVGHCTPFSDEDIATLRKVAPKEIYNGLALLTSEQRNIVRQQFLTVCSTVEDSPAKSSEPTTLDDGWPEATTVTSEKSGE